MDVDPAKHARTMLERGRATGMRLVAVLEDSARTYEHTADLAERMASTFAASGRDEIAASEHEAAKRAREAAARARATADAWRNRHMERGDGGKPA